MNATLCAVLALCALSIACSSPVNNDQPILSRDKREAGFLCKTACLSPLAVFRVRWGLLCWAFCPRDTYGSSSAHPPSCSPSGGHDELRSKRHVSGRFLRRHVMVSSSLNPSQAEVQNFINNLDVTTQGTHTIIVTTNANLVRNEINQHLPANDNDNQHWVMDGNTPRQRGGMWFHDQAFQNVIDVHFMHGAAGPQITGMDRGAGRVRLGVCLLNAGATRPLDRYNINHLEAAQIVNTCQHPEIGNYSHCRQ